MSSSTSNPVERQLSLMQLPAELREKIYRHVLDFSLPKPILPRWLQKWEEMQQQPQRLRLGQPTAAGPLVPTSLVNLQLSSRQLHDEVSRVLYQDCQFSFVLDPSYASFLDSTIMSQHDMQVLQSKTYLPRIRNVVLKVHCNDVSWAVCKSFYWCSLNDALSRICRAFGHFPGLTRLVVDIRERKPNPESVCGMTSDQWSSFSPSFERLQATCPEMEMEMVVWRKRTVEVEGKGKRAVYSEVRMRLQDYGKWLRETAREDR